MSTDTKGPKIVARTFFQQLKSSNYTPNQIIAVASELIELVTCELREREKAVEAIPQDVPAKELRPTA